VVCRFPNQRSQNYIAAMEAGARRPGRVQARLMSYLRCRFEDLFEIVLVDPETSQEQILQPTRERRASRQGPDAG